MTSMFSRAGAGLLALLVATSGAGQTVGELLPAWQRGGLDIHHINTGEGAAAFFVLPDGTTLLVDCGDGAEIARAPRYKSPRKPDESRMPGEWVARYLQKVQPGGTSAPVDFLVISHFHPDHMGGVPELLRHVTVRTVLDRGWPDYGAPLPFAGPLAPRYRAALRDQVDHHQATIERFRAGAADQIRLRHTPADFPGFSVRNLAVNGEAWTGVGTEVRARFPAGQKIDENPHSAAFRLTYGTFDYFTGGDIPGSSPDPAQPAWTDMESAIAWATGPVDVAVLNHHGNADASTPFFLSVLQPRVCIAQVWAAKQLDPVTLARLQSDRIYPGPRDLFATNGLWAGRAEHLIELLGEAPARAHLEKLNALAATQGHCVVRVAPGGARYQVLVLDDSDESLRIRSIHGPYASR